MTLPPDSGSAGPPRPRHGRDVIRRRPRQTRVIDCPPPIERSITSNPLKHARLFALALAVLITLGTVLLLSPWATAPGQQTDFYDALFLSMSASSMTGLATVDTATHWTFFGELVLLVLVQVGGLGFTVGASLILQLLRRGDSLRDAMLMRDGAPTLTLREALEFSGRIVRFTFAVEAIGAALLTLHFWLIADMTFSTALWFGIFHAVCAFCNGGFDLSTNFGSFVAYDDSVLLNVVIIALVQSGALSYIVFHDLWNERRWQRLALDTKLVLVVNGIVLLGGGAIFLIMEWSASLSDTPVWARPMGAIFQSMASRTAGYATVNFSEVTTVTLLVWIGMMAIGGASGSTAGGIKLTTTGVVSVAVISALRGHTETQVFGRRIASALVFRAMSIIAVFLILYFVVTVSLAISEDAILGQQFTTAALLFESMSALATTGLSAGITPELSNAGKVILVIAMFIGRIGPLSLAFALQNRQRPPRYRYTEEPVRIG